jgi:hypothetical protein
VILPTIAALGARGLFAAAGDRYRPTAVGFRFLNDLMAAFLPAVAVARPEAAAAHAVRSVE